MQKIDINKIVKESNSNFFERLPNFIKDLIILLLSKLIRLQEINSIIDKFNDKFGIDFIDELFEHLDISYTVSAKDKLKIPSEGKLLIVSNHPLGGVDGLILLKLISEIRTDIKIIVNNILLNIDNLKEYFIPFDLFSGKTQRTNVEQIYSCLNNNEAIIVFPAGEVSRFYPTGIGDAAWRKSILQIAKKHRVPVLPVFVHARNSLFFYIVSLFNKKLSMFLLPREVFNKKNKSFNVSIGHHIPSEAFENRYHKTNVQIKLLKKHVYLIGKGKKGVFEVEKNVIHPVSRKTIKQQLEKNILLGLTSDRKKIFLIDSFSAPDVLKEISRLREITFRKVSEGTGKKMDLDKYDSYYKHIVLWDEDELEIVGSYRIGIGKIIMKTLGVSGFYTSELFVHSSKLQNMLLHSAELGRSFVQSKYWNTSALDYLWQGIGVFLRDNPQIKYLFGGVSLSKNYSEEAKKNIIYFFNKWFGDNTSLSTAKNKFTIPLADVPELKSIYSSNDFKSEMITLKNLLKHLGYSIPTLYKQYAELCEQDGIKFIDFCIDPDFNNCVDSLILVDVSKIKESKKLRYIYNKKFNLNPSLQLETA
jgi:putative hemolysin